MYSNCINTSINGSVNTSLPGRHQPDAHKRTADPELLERRQAFAEHEPSEQHPYQGRYQLVHGDIFPGNVLVDDQHQVTALLDWGLMTMWGDHLWDIATGWVFFDMYDALRMNLRERYLHVILATVGEHLRGKLYHYVLIYSLVGANAYSSQCADGHYWWCVQNLNTAEYWNGWS